jgi:predicted nuclease of predicted toxin-antitoxin system
MRFLVDAQLPPALAEALRAEGHDAIHIVDLNLLAATDTAIWDQAAAESAILITKDRDFALLRAARRRGPAIVWIRLGNMGNKALIARVVRSMPKLLQALKRGDLLVEITS